MIDGNTALLTCHAPEIGYELCANEPGGTYLRLARNIFPGPESSRFVFLDRAADAMYFIPDDGYDGRELWRSTARGDSIFAAGFDG